MNAVPERFPLFGFISPNVVLHAQCLYCCAYVGAKTCWQFLHGEKEIQMTVIRRLVPTIKFIFILQVS